MTLNEWREAIRQAGVLCEVDGDEPSGVDLGVIVAGMARIGVGVRQVSIIVGLTEAMCRRLSIRAFGDAIVMQGRWRGWLWCEAAAHARSALLRVAGAFAIDGLEAA